ncbi:hypothetical protein F7734_44985 [Scytonema sp. UIC 10036]|uniref:Hsp70 family protein n=1 Tax=Scytonema sp. UIC 10036 TaxID=2304196 RepID=UPI0012DACD09|nr:hypothetical protein [Scytonema sp. UIC 10036]MUG99070.1 hypothetical protein [Scytonema sp. UIC 10036]
METEHLQIIGFDLGHGEVALAKVQDINNPMLPPVPLLLHKKKCQPTAIAEDQSQGVLFGEHALRTGTTTFEIAFKKKPTSDPIYQQTIEKLVKAIYEHLISTKQLYSNQKNHFFIGCPSGWNAKDVDKYQKILSKYLPCVTVVKESRAALMQAKESNIFTLGELSSSVLVIDVGSSTTDFTLVKNMEDHPDDSGKDLGASLIDKTILAYSLEQHEDKKEIEEIFQQLPSAKNKCEFLCRKYKEEYFSIQGNYEGSEDYVNVGYEKLQSHHNFEPKVNGPIMRKILNLPLHNLNNKSWVEYFHEELQKLKQNLEKQGIKPSAILLTGSASKMEFIPQMVEEVFPDSDCKRDTQPELCIANGLARWGRVYIQTEGFMKDVNNFLNIKLKDIVQSETPVLLYSLAESLADGLIENVVKLRIQAWRNRQIITLNDLEKDIANQAQAWLKETQAKTAISKTFTAWVKKVQEKVKEETNSICKRYNLPIEYLDDRDIDLSSDVTDFSEAIDIGDPTSLSAIIGLVITIVGGVIIAMFSSIFVFTGFFSAITPLILFAIKGPQTFTDAVKSTKEINLPLWIRNFVTDAKIDKMSVDKKPEFTQKLLEKLGEDIELKTQLVDSMIQWFKAGVQKQANKARLLIA